MRCIRDPDPHERSTSEEISLLTYGLTHHVQNGATHEGGSRLVLEHLLKRGGALTPRSAREERRYSSLLYQAISARSPDRVQLMLRAGSDPSVCLHVPSAAVTYKDALGYIEHLRTLSSEEEVTEYGDGRDTGALLEIERLIRDHLRDP